MSPFKKLKTKWKIESNWDFFLIMLVFSLSGMAITLYRKPFFHLLGISTKTPFWLKTVLYILFVFPMYQISLLIFGGLVGQFKFFWEKEKQMLHFIKKRFTSS